MESTTQIGYAGLVNGAVRPARQRERSAPARRGDWEQLKAGADPDDRDADGWTPLHHAAKSSGDPAVVEALLYAGADPQAEAADKLRPSALAHGNAALRGSGVTERLKADQPTPAAGIEPSSSLSPRRIEALKRFIAVDERTVPPHHAGRHDVIDDIEERAAVMWWLHDNGAELPSGITRVLQGAPGAGKTATLKHLRRKWATAAPRPGVLSFLRAKAPRGAPRMLFLDSPKDFVNARSLVQQLGNLLKPGLGDEVVASGERGWQAQVGVQVAEAGAHVQGGRSRRDDEPPDALDALFERHPAAKWRHPVVLAIDEFQNMRGEAGEPHAERLVKLHNLGHGVPLMLVLGGLGNTEAVAMRLGISRLVKAGVHALGCLLVDESEDLIEGWGKHFGLPPGRWRDAMQGIAVANDRWPMHIRNALAAFSRELVGADGDVAAVDFKAVREDSADRRESYYFSRTSGRMRRARFLVASVMKDIHPGIQSGEVVDRIEKHAGSGPGMRWRLPKDMDEEDFYMHLVHRGALHEIPRDIVECPIPSFRQYLIGLGEPSAL